MGIQRDWGWTLNMLKPCGECCRSTSPEDFVIATGESNSLEDFVATTFSQVGLDWRQHVIQDPKLFRPTEIRYSRGHPEKARRVLRWEANMRMRDVVREMIRHEQQVVEVPRWRCQIFE